MIFRPMESSVYAPIFTIRNHYYQAKGQEVALATGGLVKEKKVVCLHSFIRRRNSRPYQYRFELSSQ